MCQTKKQPPFDERFIEEGRKAKGFSEQPKVQADIEWVCQNHDGKIHSRHMGAHIEGKAISESTIGEVRSLVSEIGCFCGGAILEHNKLESTI